METNVSEAEVFHFDEIKKKAEYILNGEKLINWFIVGPLVCCFRKYRMLMRIRQLSWKTNGAWTFIAR